MICFICLFSLITAMYTHAAASTCRKKPSGSRWIEPVTIGKPPSVFQQASHGRLRRCA